MILIQSLATQRFKPTTQLHNYTHTNSTMFTHKRKPALLPRVASCLWHCKGGKCPLDNGKWWTRKSNGKKYRCIHFPDGTVQSSLLQKNGVWFIPCPRNAKCEARTCPLARRRFVLIKDIDGQKHHCQHGPDGVFAIYPCGEDGKPPKLPKLGYQPPCRRRLRYSLKRGFDSVADWWEEGCWRVTDPIEDMFWRMADRSDDVFWGLVCLLGEVDDLFEEVSEVVACLFEDVADLVEDMADLLKRYEDNSDDSSDSDDEED